MRLTVNTWGFAFVLLVLLVQSPSFAATASVQLLHSFNNNGRTPTSALTKGVDGSFFGTTSEGGAAGDGVVFKITTAGVVTTLHTFDGTHGSKPIAGLTRAADGIFYGTTESGGTTDQGTIFKITADGTFTTLFNFDGTTGAFPRAAPVQASDGNFYGVAVQGGATGNGAVYKMTPAGVTTVLHSFDGIVGKNPIGALIQGGDGALYGTTESGGTGQGGIFKVTTAGTFTSLFSFEGTRGAKPVAALLLATDGNFYGTTEAGGANNAGAIFKMTTTGTVTVSLLTSLGSANGFAPRAALIQGSDGLLYGTTLDNIFRVSTAGTFTVLYTFAGVQGGSPYAGLVRGNDGNYYGTTRDGGASDFGAVFRMSLPPTAPAGLSASPDGDQIALTWGPASSATSYDVYQGSSSGAESAAPVQSGISSTNATISELGSGTYFFKVRAVSANGESDDSNEASATVNVPSNFSFTPVAGATVDTLQMSDSVLIGGLVDNSTLPITVSGDTGAAYSIDGAPFTTATGAVTNGDRVQAQVRSAATQNTLTRATITIGRLSRDFDVATFQSDSTADSFSFTAVLNASPASVQTSNAVVISGINVPAAISVSGDSGATYSINGGTFTASSGTVSNGSTVRVRVKAPPAFGDATTKAKLTVGATSANFVVGTSEDTSPGAFAFDVVTGVSPESVQTSSTAAITGINTSAAISITGHSSATYSVNGGPFTADSSTVVADDEVRVRLTASREPETTTFADVTIGNRTSRFSVTTQAASQSSDSSSGGALDTALLSVFALLYHRRRRKSLVLH